jgi:hypothetical protein
MSSRRTRSVPKEDVVFPRMLYCDSRCSQTLTGLSLALPGALLCNATRRLGDRQRVILRQRVRGSVRAVRAVWNTRVFQTETRVVADEQTVLQGHWRCTRIQGRGRDEHEGCGRVRLEVNFEAVIEHAWICTLRSTLFEQKTYCYAKLEIY